MSYQRRAEQFIHSGPLEADVLVQQAVHRSQNIWNREVLPDITLQKSADDSLFNNIDPRIYGKLITCGFEGIVKVGALPVDHKLITALVERWRPETCTFHLPVGETTITLQDVEVLTCSRVHGRAVSGFTKSPVFVSGICRRLLGVIPPSDVMKRKSHSQSHSLLYQ